MKKLLVIIALLLACNAQAQDWTMLTEPTASVTSDGVITITFDTPTTGAWTSAITRVTVRARYADVLLSPHTPSWGGYEVPEYDYMGTLVDPSHVENGATSTVTITYNIEYGNISRYIGDPIYVSFQGVFGSSRIDFALSDWYIVEASMPVDYDPGINIAMNDSCGFAAVSIYLKPAERGEGKVKWEWYDSIDAEWKPIYPLVSSDSDAYHGVGIQGKKSELLYSVAHNNFGYIGARTDGSTRFRFRDAFGDTGTTYVGPNILGWCGIVEDVTPPTVSSQNSGWNSITKYFMTVGMNEACISRSRYRVDAGAWTDWTEWSTIYQTNHQAVYNHTPQDQTVDFEMEFKDQADLPCAANPVTETVNAI